MRHQTRSRLPIERQPLLALRRDREDADIGHLVSIDRTRCSRTAGHGDVGKVATAWNRIDFSPMITKMTATERRTHVQDLIREPKVFPILTRRRYGVRV